VIMLVIFQLMFVWSHHHNCWPKFMTTFLHAQGILAKSLDLLHMFGLMMSHKWSVHSLNTNLTNALEKVHQQVHLKLFVISYDNMNIPFCSFLQ
ncbi:hypothetical protein PAXRUDRAFT_181648, partial [Paxillus rubicundulus Ve08.2h10]